MEEVTVDEKGVVVGSALDATDLADVHDSTVLRMCKPWYGVFVSMWR
jgi:hypothetical protein